jgi:hypothetical protein
MAEFSTADPNAYIALAMQSAQGSLQTGLPKYRFSKYAAGNGFQIVPAVVDLREGGDGLDFGTSYKQRQTVRGQLVFNARPEFVGQLLQIIPGGATWNGASTPAVHTFHANHASNPWAQIMMQFPGSDMKHMFSNVRFTGLSVQWRSGMPIAVRAPFIGINAGASHNLALVASYGGEDTCWVMHNAPSYVLGGVGDSTIEEVTLDISLGIEELQAQSVELDTAVVQNRDVNWTFVKRYQDSALWRQISYGASDGVAPTSLVPTTNLSIRNLYGAGANLRLFLVESGLLSLRDTTLSEFNPDGQTVKYTTNAKALKGATSPVTFTLHNLHASAYAS